MKSVYISVPITGHNIEDVSLRIETVKYKYLKDYNVINPLELYDQLEYFKGIILSEKYKPEYKEIIGNDISYLLGCECVFFCKGWHESKGCQLEFAAAKIFGKEIMFE